MLNGDPALDKVSFLKWRVGYMQREGRGWGRGVGLEMQEVLFTNYAKSCKILSVKLQ